MTPPFRRHCLSLVGLVLGAVVAPLRAQGPLPPLPEAPRPAPPVLGDLPLRVLTAPPGEPPSPVAQAPRVPLLRVPATYLRDPLGFEPGPADPSPSAPGDEDGELARIPVAMGGDNPFLEFRPRGAPGGVGFYRLATQLPLFEGRNTGFVLACQALTPAGLESNGVSDGPTFLAPAVAVFHHLGEGRALHGYLGTGLRADGTWKETLGRQVEYGFALQQPVPGRLMSPDRGLFLCVEAYGRYREAIDGRAGPLHELELLPGLHYRLGEAWWLSGGVVVPVGPGRDAPTRQWHINCSWQF